MRKIWAIILMSLMCFMFLTGLNVKAEENNMADKKVLVAYFSATGTTAKVAEKLASVTGGELFEIKPKYPYSAADLNWMNKDSRSSIEMNDRRSRPEIANQVEDMSRYHVVFVGFPIWWYREPSIIDTFMEAYDFSDKTVVPFATSGGSGMGDSGKNMQELAPQAKVFVGERFASNVDGNTLRAWADEYLK